MVNQFSQDAFDHPDVAVKRTIQSTARKAFSSDVIGCYYPKRPHLSTSPQNVLDKAKQYMESERPKRPIRITGFLPM